MNTDYVPLFCFVDDFCLGFKPWYKKQLISDGTLKRDRRGHLLLSEIMTILISYHQSGMACFKYFYLSLIQNSRSLFPALVHYDRFVKLIKKAFPAFVCLLKSLTGEITEYLFIDSTPIGCVSHFTRKKTQNVQRMGGKRKNLNRMVLRIQAPHDFQHKRGNYPSVHYVWKCRRQDTYP